jgi:hypothetical protein
MKTAPCSRPIRFLEGGSLKARIEKLVIIDKERAKNKKGREGKNMK